MLNWRNGHRSAAPGAARISDGAIVRDLNASKGIVAGTAIATVAGWRRVETLCAGDLVMTFDHGPRPLRSVVRRRCPLGSPLDTAPQPLIALAPGVAGNAGTLLLLPGQAILFESDVAEAIYGDPFALLPARAMAGLPDVTSMLSETPVVSVSLHFDEDEVVYADGQALLYCEGAGIEAPETLEAAIFAPPARYRVLPLADARGLVEAMRLCEDAPLRDALLM